MIQLGPIFSKLFQFRGIVMRAVNQSMEIGNRHNTMISIKKWMLLTEICGLHAISDDIRFFLIFLLQGNQLSQDIQSCPTWPPRKERKYYNLQDELLTEQQTGKELPAFHMAQWFNERCPDKLKHPLFQSAQIISDLPAPFLQTFFKIQQGSNPIRFPVIMQDKNVTVGECLIHHPAMLDELALAKWQSLGWKSVHQYRNWLNTSMLFAFAHCMHYCEAPRVFDYDSQDQTFKMIHHDFEESKLASHPRTYILSVTGFELRDFGCGGQFTNKVANREKLINELIIYNMIMRESEKTMTQILEFSSAIGSVVWIPYGMGVFLNGLPDDQKKRIKKGMFEGMRQACNKYQGPVITMHLCAFFDEFKSVSNKAVRFINQQGKDAYILANRLTDAGIKTLLINAGDNDWMALLDNRKKPGQFAANHTLYHSTSDEYYALVTLFEIFSIQNMMNSLQDKITIKQSKTETQIPEGLVLRLPLPADNPFIVKLTEITKAYNRTAASLFNRDSLESRQLIQKLESSCMWKENDIDIFSIYESIFEYIKGKYLANDYRNNNVIDLLQKYKLVTPEQLHNIQQHVQKLQSIVACDDDWNIKADK